MIIPGDCLDVLKTLPNESVQTCVTSPPYWQLRDYGVAGQLGLESSPEEYVQKLVSVFSEVKRVLKDDGTLWLNLGDSYARKGGAAVGSTNFEHMKDVQKRNCVVPNDLKNKDLAGIPWRVAFALQSDGWYLRQDIIWSKPNPLPESVRDRCTKAHEYIFLLSKSSKYFFDHKAIKEKAVGGKPAGNKPGDRMNKGRIQKEGWSFDPAKSIPEFRNKRSVWTVTSKPFKGAHFATFPPDLIKPCILAGSRLGDTVLDPFFGSGTVAVVAESLDRKWIGIELNPSYCELAKARVECRK